MLPKLNVLVGLLSTLFVLNFCVGSTKGEIYFRKGSPHVKLGPDAVAAGSIKYSRDGRPFSAFIGLPFATIPERFAESQLVTNPDWHGRKEFVKAGPMCPQLQIRPDQKMNLDEDCLNLNVYVPMNNTSSKKGYPVMVWIHGGGFIFGGGYGYLPTYFMDEDVVLVTINYRVGIFGFLSTGDAVAPGNNGLKDQVMALKWVQQNIAKFGGNSNRVSIFGESAGGASVHYLLLSPTAKGLFHSAISQSGSALNPWAYQPPKVSRQNAAEIAAHLNCSSTLTSQEILSCFKSFSKEELILAEITYKLPWVHGLPALPFGPTAEPEVNPADPSTHTPFLTKSPRALITVPENDDIFPAVEVPWLVGVTENEGAGMVGGSVLTDERFVQELNSQWPDRVLETFVYDRYFPNKEEKDKVCDKLRNFYFGDKQVSFETSDGLIDLCSDGLILNGVYKAVKETVSRGKNKAPVYLYQYGHYGPMSIGSLFYPLREQEKQKIGHADDLQHLFDMDDSIFPGAGGAVKEDTPDADFSRHFVRLWASFAKNGKPTHSWGNSEKWRPLSKSDLDDDNNLPWYRIDSNPKYLDNDPYKGRMEFWEELWRDHFVAAEKDKHRYDKVEL